MIRTRQLLDLWAWLPAFRAVAETEHLPTAALKMHVTPSALSRSVRLLEEHLGQTLFDRAARRLTLNHEGRKLLCRVRSAMRIVDEGIEEISEDELGGPVYLSIPPDLSEWLLLPVFLELQKSYPAMIPQFSHRENSEVASSLQRGELDAAVIVLSNRETIDKSEVEREMLVSLVHGIYARPTHTLADRPALEWDDLKSYPFVVWPGDNQTMERLEPAVQAPDLRSAACLAEHSDLLISLPDVFESQSRKKQRLARLDVSNPTMTTLYVVYRKPVAEQHMRTEAVVKAIRQAAGQSTPVPPTLDEVGRKSRGQ